MSESPKQKEDIPQTAIDALRESIFALEDTNNFRCFLDPKRFPHSVLIHDIDGPIPNKDKNVVVGRGSKLRDVKDAFRTYRALRPEEYAAAQQAVSEYHANPLSNHDEWVELDEDVLKPLLADMVPLLVEFNVDPFDLTL